MHESVRCHHPIIKNYLPGYLRGELDADQAYVVRDHLSRCQSCHKDFTDLRHEEETKEFTRQFEHEQAKTARDKFYVVPKRKGEPD